ncbi:MAG: S1 RNA-binding domain-containing protein, partial [Calditrichaeota bacterium]
MATDEKKLETKDTTEIPIESPTTENKIQDEIQKAEEPAVEENNTEKPIMENPVEEEDKPFDAELAAALDANMDFIVPEDGKMLKGTILTINEEHALVDCGAKSEAILATNELDGHKEGDEVEGLVVQLEPLTISLKLGQTSAAHNHLKDAFDNGVPVIGKITREIKGGFDVDISGLRAFLPISQLDTTFIKDTKPFINKELEFKIMEFADNGKQFIISRAEILKKELSKKLDAFWETIKIGEIREGVVRSFQFLFALSKFKTLNKYTNVERSGAFIDILNVLVEEFLSSSIPHT